MNFGVAINTFYGAERLHWLLDSIERFCSLPLSDIVVRKDLMLEPETGLTTAEVCAKHKVRLTSAMEWKWCVLSADRAIQNCNADVVFILNDDILVSRGTLETIAWLYEHNQHVKIGAVSGTLMHDGELVAAGVIPNHDAFYPPTWHTGNRMRMQYGYDKIQLRTADGTWLHSLPGQFAEKSALAGYICKRPIMALVTCGFAFAVSKQAACDIGGLWPTPLDQIAWRFALAGYGTVACYTPPFMHAHSRACQALHWKGYRERHPEEYAKIAARTGLASEVERWHVEHYGGRCQEMHAKVSTGTAVADWPSIQRTLLYLDFQGEGDYQKARPICQQ